MNPPVLAKGLKDDQVRVMNGGKYLKLIVRCIGDQDTLQDIFLFRFALDIAHKNKCAHRHNSFCYYFPKILWVICRTVENRKKSMKSMVLI